MQDKLTNMLTLQETLNNNTNGEMWKEGVTKNAKTINWKRCIYMECAELIDSFSWKHWKSIDAGIDYANIKIELVDIWHFTMSEMLRTQSPAEIAKIVTPLIDADINITLPRQWKSEDNAKLDAYIEIFEELMAISLVKTENEFYNEMLCDAFFKSCAVAELGFEELYQLYIGKNALNHFRQQHGYKEGTYIKVWDGQEDNVVMQEILTNVPDIGYEQLLDALEDRYIALS